MASVLDLPRNYTNGPDYQRLVSWPAKLAPHLMRGARHPGEHRAYQRADARLLDGPVKQGHDIRGLDQRPLVL